MAPELLVAGGGHTYRGTHDLRVILTSSEKSVGALPAVFDWDRTTAADTLRTYQALREHHDHTVGA